MPCNDVVYLRRDDPSVQRIEACGVTEVALGEDPADVAAKMVLLGCAMLARDRHGGMIGSWRFACKLHDLADRLAELAAEQDRRD